MPTASPASDSPFNYLSLLNTPTPLERNLPARKALPPNAVFETNLIPRLVSSHPHSANKSVHFAASSSPIVPKRLFERNPAGDLPQRVGGQDDYARLLTRSLNQHPNPYTPEPSSSVAYPSQPGLKSTPPRDSKPGRDWVQELVDQPKPSVLNSSFNRFPSKPPSTPEAPRQPALLSRSHGMAEPSSQKKGLAQSQRVFSGHPQEPSSPQPKRTARIPLSMNPANAGVMLGRARLIHRIRVNLISLAFVWMATSTKLYNEAVASLVARVPSLSAPLQIIEWLSLVVLLLNIVEGYYRLKTQVPATHVDLPLTPQQLRGSRQPSKHGAGQGSPNGSGNYRNSSMSPFPRHAPSQGMPKSSLALSAHPSPAPKSWSTAILTHDPLVNPLSRSTAHLFKSSTSRSSADSQPAVRNLGSPADLSLSYSGPNSASFGHAPQAQLSRSVRKVSNANSLRKLLEETL